MDIVNKLKKIGDVAVEKGKEFGNAAVNKGMELGNVAKLNLEIMNLESDIEKEKNKIGNIMYSENIKTDNDDINACIAKINNLKKQIDAKKIELEKK